MTLEEKSNIRGLTLHDPDHTASESRLIDQWDGTEGPEIDPRKYRQLISDEGVKAIQGTKSIFNKCAGTTGHLYAKNESRHRPYTVTKINAK